MQQLFKVIDTRDNSDVTNNPTKILKDEYSLKSEYENCIVDDCWLISSNGELLFQCWFGESEIDTMPAYYKVQFNKDALTAILAKL